MKLIEKQTKDMANGMRDMSRRPLSADEIDFVKSEIRRIEADESVFVFNDEDHQNGSTCYNFIDDKIYVTRNVFPDTKYGSTHPRDIMSVGAVLAHEYYGHRAHRQEYLDDYKKGHDFHSTPIWQDECRTSIVAAKTAPNLTDIDTCNLVMDAIYRADEYNHYIEMDSFMKEAVYGYSDDERHISADVETITYIVKAGNEGTEKERNDRSNLSEVWDYSKDDEDFEL